MKSEIEFENLVKFVLRVECDKRENKLVWWFIFSTGYNKISGFALTCQMWLKLGNIQEISNKVRNRKTVKFPFASKFSYASHLENLFAGQ